MNPNEAPESIEQTDSIRNESISFETALAIVKRADIDSRIKAIRELVPTIYADICPLNPIEEQHGKYLNIEASSHGYRPTPEFHLSMYFGEGLRMPDVESFAQVEQFMRAHDPEQIRLKRIEALQTELAKLTAETKNEGAD